MAEDLTIFGQGLVFLGYGRLLVIGMCVTPLKWETDRLKGFIHLQSIFTSMSIFNEGSARSSNAKSFIHFHSYSATNTDNRRVRRTLCFKPCSFKNAVVMNFLTFAKTSNASQYVDKLKMTPARKACWKASLIEQLIPKNALRENTSNQTQHLIGPFLVLVA